MGHKNIRKQDPVRHYRETFSVCRSTPVSCGQNERYVLFIYFLYNFLVFFLLLKEYFTRRSTNEKDVEIQFIFLEISI